VNATVAAIFRSIGDTHPPTLIIDEADTLFGSKRAAENNEDLRALLNAGHQRGRPALRCVGPLQIPTEFHTFAMAAVAGIGAMPDTITDRGINIGMRRRARGEKVAQFRSRRDGPILKRARDRLAQWAAAHIDALSTAEPDMPVEDRAADTFEPLIAVADAAGGHWPKTARAACKALVDAADTADEERSESTKLLMDIKRVFADKGVAFMPSAELVAELRRIEESPWNDFELTRSKRSYRLREFRIKTRHNAAASARGYRLDDFSDAFARYTRQNPSEPVNPQFSDDSPLTGSDVSDVSTRQTADNPSDDNRRLEPFSDGLTVPDGSAAENGARLPVCPCGRPAPVDPDTGLCHWCALQASKADQP